MHDLTHYAVETILDCRRAFFGLVSEGWDLEDFGTPWPRGPMPAEALTVEVIVNSLDMQRRSGEGLTAAHCNRAAAEYFGDRGEASPVRLTDEQLDAVHDLRARLVRQWQGLGSSGTMELPFASPSDPAPRR